MKKVILILVAVMGLGFAASAQNIGVRLGGGTAYGGEISFQAPMGNQRIELDLGFNYPDYINLAGIYQWKGAIAGDFGWFAGPGLNLGYCINHGFGVAALVQGGVEFNPQAIPFQFSLDFRPQWDFIKREGCAYNGFGWGWAVGIRYRL